MDIFVPIRFRTSIQLSPADLVADFQQVLLERVRGSLEGVCSRYGYIRPGSIAITKRSAGSFVKQHFNGHIKFDLICRAEVCNPNVGAVFQAIVKNKNALGIHAESVLENDGKEETVLDIIIPKRSVGIVSMIDLEHVNIGDRIHVEVLGKRYQLHDKKISIIGRAIREPVASTSTPFGDEEQEGVLVDGEGGEDMEQFVESVVDEDLEDDDEDEGEKSDGDDKDGQDDDANTPRQINVVEEEDDEPGSVEDEEEEYEEPDDDQNGGGDEYDADEDDYV